MDKPTGSSHLNFTLAAVLGGGGLAGYFKAKSVPSLVAGLSFATIYVGAGVLINQGSPAQGHGLAVIPSTALLTSMAWRAGKSGGKPMPLALAILGTGATIYNVQKYFEWRE